MLHANPNGRLAWLRVAHWTGILPHVIAAYPNAQIAMDFDDMLAMEGAVKAGIGVTRLSCFRGDPDPELVRLLEVPLMQFLSARLQSRRSLFGGTLANKGERPAF